jgi:hypothetical protein
MTAIMGMATLSVLTSILVLYLYHHSTTRRAPVWLRTLAFHWLARILCMHAAVPPDDPALFKPSVSISSSSLP